MRVKAETNHSNCLRREVLKCLPNLTSINHQFDVIYTKSLTAGEFCLKFVERTELELPLPLSTPSLPYGHGHAAVHGLRHNPPTSPKVHNAWTLSKPLMRHEVASLATTFHKVSVIAAATFATVRSSRAPTTHIVLERFAC